jgi:ribosomal protein S18 acetylase RimI-like enzyme
MSDVTFAISQFPTPAELGDLRASVGWGRQDSDYPRAFQGYWATVSGRADDGLLVAWCAILSDGVYHAVLLDVIVHPAYQGYGHGLMLVQTAIAHCQAAGIGIIHVDYLPEKQGFYERCGFETGLGGILELP